MRTRLAFSLTLLSLLMLRAAPVGAYVSQVDATLVPQTGRMQACLNRPGTGEPVAGAVDAIADAATLPEAYRPVRNAAGRHDVTFNMIGEGAGFLNIFGYYWTDEDPNDPANLHMIFDCRQGADGPGGVGPSICNCPCDPTVMRTSDGSPYSWQRTINFALEPGFSEGRAIGFFIRTPEQLSGGRNNNHCGGPSAANQDHRTYFTSAALNDDGDFVHFLVYESTVDNTYYFGFEDLFRGGDNDYEDVLARVTGLVPICSPQPETCNNADDDCDLNVDEGIDRSCSTACGDGVQVCDRGRYGTCTAPTPSAESCNDRDDDCDTRVDEGISRACSNMCGSGTEICVAGDYADCSAPAPTIERCNNNDDDCDGSTDEDLTRACFRACGSGTETCTGGRWGGCTASGPSAETCDGSDEDCDGRTDEGLTRACSSACGSGTETCISGSFVGCTAAAPGLEACNNNDDDCDGRTDEDLARACSSACGTGTENCDAGSWVGCDAPTASVEVCNNIDDDCDGVIDDGDPGGGALCIPTGPDTYEVVTMDDPRLSEACVAGRVTCIAGELVCRGAGSPTREICNCEDDDCDGIIDEGTDATLCPDGRCVACMCSSSCSDSEFPCPPGRVCDRSFADDEIIGLCVPGMCAGVECTEEETCDPSTGACINLCEDVSCADGFACVRGSCVENSCYGRGCESGERCRDGSCEADPCVEIACSGLDFCRDGICIPTCPECGEGEVCSDGLCVTDPCEGSCGASQTCVAGDCVDDECGACGAQRICSAGECVHDPCGDIRCPTDFTCRRGECLPDEGVVVPPSAPRLGLATGGGGCSCAVPGSAPRESPSPAWFGLFGLFVMARRRSSRRAKASRRAAVTRALVSFLSLVGALTLTSGCAVDPYCFGDCEEDPVDTGPGVDTSPPEDTSGCVITGDEICDEEDNDCDGLVDEGFNILIDPGNCGGCGQECVLPNAFPACDEGSCAIARCEVGFNDLDGVTANGCEYACIDSGAELCDTVDNDCDGATDEGIDTSSDLAHCGECGNLCVFANATATCEAGTCVMGDCNTGFSDLDSDMANGCELRCTPTGAETCNSVDDDCDLATDEGFDTTRDPMNCGTCGTRCAFPNATGVCTAGVCGIGACAPGFFDVDGRPETGCEYACTVSGADVCNGEDDDCDGATDEGDPMVGAACGVNTGACARGINACQFGRLVCVGGREPTPETCNATDDDCDGRTDESTGAEPIAGVGARCGETNVGPCRFGTVECISGALACGGSYIGPATETCNGIDDDCDGTTDDSPTPPASTPASCRETRGVCAGRTAACDGARGWGCTLPDTYLATETLCDGLDNDCDGARDEGCLTPRPASDVRIDVGDASGAANSVQPVTSGNGANTAYVAWMDRRFGDAHVLFSRSASRGNAGSWSSPVQVDRGGGAAIGPRLAPTNANEFAAAWADFRGGSSFREIYTRHSANQGASFSGDVRRNPAQNSDSFNVEMASAGSRVYVVYENFTSFRNRHIFLVASSDRGRTFSAPIRVDRGDDVAVPGFVAATPVVAAVGNNVYVAWRDNRNGGLDVFFNRSTNGGASFAASDTRIDTGEPAGASSGFAPTLAAEGANVYIAWVDDRDAGSFDILFNRSTNSGASFATPTELDDDPLPHDSIEPQIVAPSGGTAIVAWVDYRYGFPDIVTRRTVSAGASFEPITRLDTGTDPGTDSSLQVALSANGDLVSAVFVDDRAGALDIYANYSLDGGAVWQPSDVRLDTSTVGTSDSTDPDVFVSDDEIFVSWVDNRGGAFGDIYFRRLQP